MRLNQLFEVPVSNYQFIEPDMVGTNRSSFSAADVRRAKAADFISRLDRAFRAPFDFRLFLIQHTSWPNADLFVDKLASKHGGLVPSGRLDVSELAEEGTIPSQTVEASPSSITVVYMSNAGPNRVTLSPWILAHRFGHAVSDAATKRVRLDLTYAYRRIGIIDYLNDDIVQADKKRYPGDGNSPEVYAHLLTTGFARGLHRTNDYDALNSFEVPMEMMAQYLIRGEVRLGMPPIRAEKQKWLARQVKKTEVEINSAIAEVLSLCVGELFVAV